VAGENLINAICAEFQIRKEKKKDYCEAERIPGPENRTGNKPSWLVACKPESGKKQKGQI
jgi:hypothetical protein